MMTPTAEIAPAQEKLVWQERLRTFHLTGQGLEEEEAQPLRPAIFESFRPAADEPCEAVSLPALYGGILAKARREARANWLARVAASRNRMRELLAVDDSHAPEAESPENLESTLGAEGNVFFDAGALAKAARKPKGLRRMPAGRRARIEAALEALDGCLRQAATQPAAWVFHSGAEPAGSRELGWESRNCDDSFRAALEFSRQMLEDATEAWRAIRVANVEAESGYDEMVHGERLRRFNWQAATAEELLALPAVIVVESAARVAESSFTAFGRLLRSGYPVQILVSCPGVAPDLPDLAYLAMAHREAFVLSSSLARLEHLTGGLAEMAASLRPAVAVVAVPSPGEGWPEATTAALTRAHPLYRYDPDKGESWRDRFALTDGEHQDGPWPAVETGTRGREFLTPAHAAAMSAALRNHFRLIPPWACDDGQMELGEYLRRFEKQPPLAIPFIWVLGEGNEPRRAAVTRQLAVFCRDRGSAWRGLRELAGINNAHVTEAVAAAREQLRTEAEAREQAARDSVGREAAAAAVGRLVQVLLGGEPLGAAAMASQPAPVPSPAPVQSSPAPPAPAEAPSGDPYIDSALCTSCNDCFKVNQRMFQYDANKQAYIADAAAGTYAELVKAAEACPAKCIHPGAPRPGDATGTPAMMARAAQFG